MNPVAISLRVSNIDEAIRFYTAVFGRAPTDVSFDRARWTFESPAMDFSISAAPGRSTPGAIS